MRKILCALVILCLVCVPFAGAEVAAGGSHALFLDANGDVWAWGSNHRGESAPGVSEACVSAPLRVFSGAKAVRAGRQLSYALTDENELWVWGNGREAPGKIRENVLCFDACEDAYVCALSGGRVVYASESGELVYEAEAVQVACGAEFILYLTAEGNAYFIGSGDFLPSGETAAKPVLIMENCAGIWAGGQTALFADRDGRLYVMGASGSEGRLGLDYTGWVTSPVPNGGENAVSGVCGVSAGGYIGGEGDLYMWGTVYSLYTLYAEDGQVSSAVADSALITYGKTPVRLFSGVVSAAAGDAFCVAELADGSLLTWGSNDCGQAGDGTVTLFEASMETDDDGEDDIEINVTENMQHVFPAVIGVK